jgi:hypothetical protein
MTETCNRCGRTIREEGRRLFSTETCAAPDDHTCQEFRAAYLRGLSDGLAYSLDVTCNRGCRPMYEIANDGRSDASDVIRSTLRDLQNGTERPDLVGYVGKKGASR